MQYVISSFFIIKHEGVRPPSASGDAVNGTLCTKLFSDDYATRCTLIGRGKGVIHKIGDSEVLKTLKKVIKEVICAMMKNDILSDSEIETITITRKKKSLGLITSGHFKKILNLEKKKTPKIQLQFNSTTNLPDVQSNIEIDHTVIDTQSLSFPNIISQVQCSSNSHLSTINSNSSLNISYDTHLPHLKHKTNISVKDKLRQWVIKHKISHNATNSLLGILKCEGLNVPIDVRTLMKTPTKPQEVIIMGHGSYIHCGIKNMLVPVLKKYFNMINCEEDLKLGINVDGLPISNSSKSQLWPILISLINCQPINKYVLPVGIFHGSTKPTSVHEFFQPFVDDLCTPAKNFLLNVRAHNAYFGCSSCTQEGEYIQHRMTFPEIDAPLKTNDSFRNKVHEEYHKRVIKRLITFWVKGKKDVRLTEEDTLSVSKNILALRPNVPSEFSRKP
ncbi:hypothetical protein AGLY_015684 [Aphis glycines]|uniref:DUF4806 domain-containing protein n=1 Tax=Aphis glycines TaxID=307491 RepID=A0A6G0T2A6_APHGL|nr:hypothetical protein AGLY_015684 [Aphis glycines]